MVSRSGWRELSYTLAANIDSVTFTDLEVRPVPFEMSKARGDLLLPIRTVEEVRNVRCAAIQRVPSVIPDQLQCFCCLLYTSPSPRDRQKSRMPSSA